MVNITHVNLLTLAASIPYANELYGIANASTDHISFLSYSELFGDWLWSLRSLGLLTVGAL
jgi:gluconolactonase